VKARSFIIGALLTFALHGAAQTNQLLPSDTAAGWKPLFDGVSFKGWRGYRKQSFPLQGWRVEQGILKKTAGEQGGDIITEATFENFDLVWEWRIAPGGNNGVKYLVTEGRPGAPGHEYQLLDDDVHPDGKRGPKRQTASFYDVLPPDAGKTLRPPGQWNESRILVQGNHVEHWLNGKKVLEYDLESEQLASAVANSKFKSAPGFGSKIRGHIMLTDHGDECWFRNVKIRELPSR
jgi:hypothetical protein